MNTVAGIHSAVCFSPVLYFTTTQCLDKQVLLIPVTVFILLAPFQPVNLVQNDAANTESSVVVQWQAPLETGGVSISTYTVTVDVDGRIVSQNITSDMFTLPIFGLEYNTEYDVGVTTINSCGIRSQPATTTVFIDASGQWNIHRPHGIFTVLTFLSSSTSAQTAPSSPLL